MIKVYHNHKAFGSTEPGIHVMKPGDPTPHSVLFDDKLKEAVSESFPQDFTLVAEVDTEELGEVFKLTNHIDHAWMDNEKVTPLAGREVRSTSVSDVFVTENGKRHIVDHCGWIAF